jgi:hypothetical protein
MVHLAVNHNVTRDIMAAIVTNGGHVNAPIGEVRDDSYCLLPHHHNQTHIST